MVSRSSIAAVKLRSIVCALALLMCTGAATWATSGLPARMIPLSSFSSTLAGPENWTAETVIEELTYEAWYIRHPLVLWIDPSLKAHGGLEYSNDRSFRAQIEAMSAVLGAYHEKQRGDLCEVVWADDAAYGRIRQGMDDVVPPIILADDDPSSFPEMWSTVSGVAITCEQKRLPLPASSWTPPDLDRLMLPNMNRRMLWSPTAHVFAVKTPAPIDEFMDLLAAQVDCFAEREGDGWRFVPLSERDVRPKHIRRLLAQVLEDPYEFGHCAPGRALVALGRQALPATLGAFDAAEDYHLLALTNVLAQLDYLERDKAFLERLDAFARDPYVFDTTTFVSVMMETLAESGSVEAIPVLRRIAEDGSAHLAARAKIALNRLGHPVSVTGADDRVTFASDVGSDLPHYATLGAALVALADHGLLWPEGRVRVAGAIENEADGLTFSGHGVTDKGSHWELRLSKPDDAEVSVLHTSHGSSHDVCFFGLLHYRDGRWLPVRWRYASPGLHLW